MEYFVVAYYIIQPIEDPEREIEEHHSFLESVDAKGRIYINAEGINAQMSISKEDLHSYLEHVRTRFESVEFKIDPVERHVFAKLTVKYRDQLVAIDEKVDFTQSTNYLSPQEWSDMLENRDEDTILIDVRNDYETDVGHFEGAICPKLNTFREFPEYVEALKNEYDLEKTKVMMCCTGGIRCEYFGPMMREKGFTNIYQLHGGIINYGHEMGNKHWKGKLFVFDDRMVVPISDDLADPITYCAFCEAMADHYYNCANVDCNDLFIACPECHLKMHGCCSSVCEVGRVRPLFPEDTMRPFRKMSVESKKALEPVS